MGFIWWNGNGVIGIARVTSEQFVFTPTNGRLLREFEVSFEFSALSAIGEQHGINIVQ